MGFIFEITLSCVDDGAITILTKVFNGRITKKLCHECYMVNNDCNEGIDSMRFLKFGKAKLWTKHTSKLMKHTGALKIFGNTQRFRFLVGPLEKIYRTI